MAEPLSADRAGPNMTRASFIEFVERHDAIDDELLDAKETVRSINRRRKDLRKVIGENGFPLAEFDRALADRNRSGEEREAADEQYRKMMAWHGKPVGFQTKLDLEAEVHVFTASELKAVDRDGFAAGKAGYATSLNSHVPGTEAYQRWSDNWQRGQAARVHEHISPEPSVRRGRGRPPRIAPVQEVLKTAFDTPANADEPPPAQDAAQ